MMATSHCTELALSLPWTERLEQNAKETSRDDLVKSSKLLLRHTYETFQTGGMNHYYPELQ